MINSKRQSNFELLRIVAMMMIVGHHYVVHGVQERYIADEALKIWGGWYTEK